MEMKKKLWNMVFYIGIENIHYWNKTESHFIKEPQYELLPKPKTPTETLWDFGSSLGFYSLYAATYPYNYNVIAFDLSPRANRLLRKTIRKNQLETKIEVAGKPVTVTQQFYRAPLTSHQSNKLKPGSSFSIDFSLALSKYGCPSVIKMDIEGGELGFLRDDYFVSVVKERKIKLFIECHSLEAQGLCHIIGMTQSKIPNHWYLL